MKQLLFFLFLLLSPGFKTFAQTDTNNVPKPPTINQSRNVDQFIILYAELIFVQVTKSGLEIPTLIMSEKFVCYVVVVPVEEDEYDRGGGWEE